MKRILPGLWPLVLMLVTQQPVQAAWLGLNDGDYLINLNCTQSTQIACPSTTTGTITVAGSEIVAMDVLIDGASFAGNPTESQFAGPLVDFDASTLSTGSPFTFLSLRLITDGQISTFNTGDLWWVYCNETANPAQCAPNTTGLWTAQLLPSAVPEPSSPALLAVSLGALAWAARRRRA